MLHLFFISGAKIVKFSLFLAKLMKYKHKNIPKRKEKSPGDNDFYVIEELLHNKLEVINLTERLFGCL